MIEMIYVHVISNVQKLLTNETRYSHSYCYLPIPLFIFVY